MRLEPVDSDGFRRALGSFASGVTVITLHDEDGVPHGMTVSAFTSVSVEPPQVLVCLHRDSRTYSAVRSTGHFGINILAAEAQSIAEHCARPGADKVLDPAWVEATSADGAPPVLRDALAVLDCTVVEELVGGTHAVLIAAVGALAVAGPDRVSPLVYFRGRFRDVARDHAA